MATQLQMRRGTTAQVAAFTGANGEVVVDTEKKTLFVNDGSTAGGLEIARADFSNISASATLTLATLNATTLNTTNLDLTNLEVTNIKAKDGTAAGSIADSTGVVTIASAVLTTADINAGTFDGVVGGTTPQAGSFTTITGSGDLVMDTTTLVVDSTNNKVGIGIAAPIHDLHIHKASSSSQARIQMTTSESGATGSDGYAIAMETDGRAYHWLYENANMVFATNNTLAMTIDSSQRAAIGTATPGNSHANANLLVVGSGSAGGIGLWNGANDGGYYFSRDNANNSDAYDGGMSYDANRNLKFHTNAGAARMSISSGGDVSIVDGNLIFADGHGLDFSDTPSGSGVSGASHLFHEYEEGEFTPTLDSTGSATFSYAYYTKIGRLVRFSFQVQALSNTTSSADIVFAGLPFPVKVGESAGVSFGTYTDDPSSNVIYTTTAEAIYLYGMSTASWKTMTHSDLNNTSNYFYIAGSYTAQW